MNVPTPVNIDPTNDVTTTTTTTTTIDHRESKMKTDTSTYQRSLLSSPDDILDDIASSISTMKKENSSAVVVVVVNSKPLEILSDTTTIKTVNNNPETDTTPSTTTKKGTTTTNESTTASDTEEIVVVVVPVEGNDDHQPLNEHQVNDHTIETVITTEDKISMEENDDGCVTTNNTSSDCDLPIPETEEEEDDDEEVRLAMEMAMAVTTNPHLSPHELQKLVGEKNAQVKMIDEFSKQNEEKIKKHKELQRLRSSVSTTTTGLAAMTTTTTTATTTTTGVKASSVASSWWTAATKKAEEMKDRAERSLYAEQISNDPTIMELRKTMKILKKTWKAHRLQGNRVETRHAFKRQRMEKRLMQSTDKLKKTQTVFTNSSYNVQEYLKAMMRASKKWRKVGSDDELLLEAQLSRNMHQMLALEKQKVQCKKNTKELKKYLQRCKGWLSDKKAFCEMNIMTIDATQNSIMRLYEETLRRQDKLIQTYKSSDEFVNVDLTDVDLSHITIPNVSYQHPVSSIHPNESSLSSFHDSSNAMRGLPIVDSIRKKKGYLDHSFHSEKESETAIPERVTDEQGAVSRKQLLEEYYKHKKIAKQHQSTSTTPELYVVANKDDESVSSRLSDPDASFNNGDINHSSAADVEEEEESDNDEQYSNDDAPWNADHRQRHNSTDSSNLEINISDIITK